ncbi:MAG: HDIG domain-containing protein [Parachlamydia sp.]|nr:HDIG domain-containing protein [Parachlamydia sp.]
MQERLSEIDAFHELKFSREPSFFDKSRGIRWLIGLGFTAFLFLFVHFRQERVEILELNSVAPDYIVAQVDFDFLDEEATIILKQEAVQDAGRIYQIFPKEIHQQRIEFANFLLYNQEWRNSVSKSSSYDTMEATVDLLEKTLLKLRFSDPRTFQKVLDIHLTTENYSIFTPGDLDVAHLLPAKVWESLRALLEEKIHNVESVNFVINYFKPKLWQFEEDIPAQRTLRRKIQETVPDKYTHVSAGSLIISQGDRVTSRHIAMLQAMKNAVGAKRNLGHPLTILGSALLAMLFAGIGAGYLHVMHPYIFFSNRKLFLICAICVITLTFGKLTELLLLSSKNNLIDSIRYPLFVPFAAILLCSLMNTGVATFISGFLAIIMALALVFDKMEFLLLNVYTSIVVILTTRSLRRRKEIFVVCGQAWICAVALIFAFHMYAGTLWSMSLFIDLLSTAICMLLIAVLVVGLLPLLETGFRIMTDVTLMEYMDPNNDLLRRLSIEAPGTYQHSVVVGNLAEAAATAIEANGLFCRVATLYHDVGKIVTPQYFTENQQGNVNIHQLLTPQESAHVIIAHVSEGVALARKAGLPEQFIDIIKEHHGTTLTYYFYRKQLDLVGGDKSLVDEKDFRYSGPKPRSKESAIIMIADSLEAASRSLEKMSEESLNELATRLIKEKAEDGQFDHSVLTFEELAIVKATLVKTLVAYGHSRVKYPQRDVKPVSPQQLYES